jgi:[ribosomal protein S5]-alanine N-acetyltransferase
VTPTLETERLILRPIELADAEQLQKIFPQWEIVKHLANKVPWPYPSDGALTYIRDVVLPAVERGESWMWTLRLQINPGQIIGAIDLGIGETDNRGFWLAPEWHGQGLMTEASDAATEFWFNTLKFTVLRSPKAIANEASRRISIRQGMRVVKTEDRDYVCGRLPSEIWEITAEEWNSRKRSD